MASPQPDINMICPVCFGSQDILKIVGQCKHSFCMTCLTRHLQRQKSRETKFRCPTCNADCVLPTGGLDGLADFTGAGDVKEQAAEEGSSIDPQPESGREKIPEDLNRLVDVKCQICHHRNIEVQAANQCPECDQLHLCRDCTAVHAKGKATKDHTVVPLKIPATEGEAICTKHSAPLTKYCSTCGKPACKICVMLEHNDHDVKKLSDTISQRVQEVKLVYEQQEGEMKKLKCLKNELGRLKTVAPRLDRQDILIKQVEDHAQKCVDQIVTWKDNMKERIRSDFKIINEIPAAYEAASNNVKKLEKPLTKAAALLSNTEQHLSYLEKLTSVEQELDAVPKMAGEMEGEKYYESLRELQQRNPTFYPAALPLAIGKLDIDTANIFQPEEIFSKRLEADSKDMCPYIPCVASFGKKYAIAHPTTRGQPASAIDIYEFPDKFCRTMTDQVKPVYDMTSTYKGNLAVLSEGNKGTSSSSIKVFDPETGNILSIFNLDIGKPMSIGFGLQNQYVILSAILSVWPQGKRQITIVDADGNVEYKRIMDHNPEVTYPFRISCGLRCIFVMGENGVAVYEIQGKDPCKDLVQTNIISKWIKNSYDVPFDISASLWDHLLLVDLDVSVKRIYLIKYSERGEKEPWKGQYSSVLRGASKADIGCRIATSDYHIVASFGQKFSVYEYHH